MATAEFDDLVREGLGVDVESRWGAGFLEGRYQPGRAPWSWREVAAPLVQEAGAVLDMGTGDGSALVGLAPLAALTVAYEEWLPTVPSAVKVLRPLGVHVVVALGSDENMGPRTSRPQLPFADASFDLVLNRHEAFDPVDVRRLIRPGGRFVTQQVGHDESSSVRALLDLGTEQPPWDLTEAIRQVEAAGFSVVDSAEARPDTRFTDVGALVAYLRSVPWEVPEFDVRRFRTQLQQIHERCVTTGSVQAIGHRFYLSVRRS